MFILDRLTRAACPRLCTLQELEAEAGRAEYKRWD